MPLAPNLSKQNLKQLIDLGDQVTTKVTPPAPATPPLPDLAAKLPTILTPKLTAAKAANKAYDDAQLALKALKAARDMAREAAPDLWKTLADCGQIEQVVLNLAINARDAMPDGGRLTIGLRNTTLTAAEALHIADGRPGEFVLLTVTDTGTGMSRETVTRIFEPFFTTKEAGKGTGLGLATCHGIIKQTSGMIAVSSVLGEGTTFSVYLPEAEGEAPTMVHAFKSNELPRGTETILFVEDEDILRELGTQVLSSLGYRVVAAEGGTAAVAKLLESTAHHIDLVVTDLMMPRMTGRELIAWIGKNVGEMRVLFMSGYTDDEIIRNAVQGAEVEYLQKPFTPHALARKIREVLDRKAIDQAA